MLNHNQRKIIESSEKSIFVVSGAGTGKTTVIFHRILYLLSKKAIPQSILVISFTTKSVNDIKKRFIRSTDNPVIKTFHGLAFSHSDCFFSKTLVDYDSPIFQQYDQQMLTEILAKKGVLTFKNMTTKPLSNYNAILTRFNLFDYIDLEIEFYNKLKEIRFRTALQNQYLYILVDEAQDMSIIQVNILKQLVNEHTSLVFVGDPDQSIYAFRGSQSTMVSKIIKDFNCTVHSLNDSYRCPKLVIDHSNKLIAHNRKRIKKDLLAHKSMDGILEYHMFSDTKKEAEFVFSKIQYFVHEKIQIKDMIVLVRNHFQSNEIKRLLALSYYQDLECLSIHQAKGLEFKVVFIIGITDDSRAYKIDIEEERRLLFVAMTRTKEALIMTSPQSKSVPRFIKEAGVKVTKH